MAEHDTRQPPESTADREAAAPAKAGPAAGAQASPRLQLKHSLRGLNYTEGAARLRFEGGATGTMGDPVGTAREGVRGGGEVPHRAEMEQAFGTDFSGVRAHTRPAAVVAGRTPTVSTGGAPEVALHGDDAARAAWEARTLSLAGKWAKTARDAPGRTPHRLAAHGGWAETGEVIPAGTRVFVSGINQRDGAVMVNWRQPGGGYRQVWLEQAHVVEDSAPAEEADRDRERQNLAGGATAATAADQQRQNRQAEATRDMGEVRRFDGSFYRAAGGVLDALIPNVGDAGKLQINVNIPVTASGNVKVAFQFIMTGERSANGLAVRCEAGGGVLAVADLWLVEVFARAMLFGYIEANGDTGEEIFRLFSLALYDKVRGESRDAAEAVWGDRFLPDTIADMDRDDTVESGLGVELAVGGRVRSVSPGGGDNEAVYSERTQMGTRLSASRGRLQSERTRMRSQKLTFESPPWGGLFELRSGTAGGVPEGDITIYGTRMANLLEFGSSLAEGALRTTLIHWAGGVLGTVTSLLRGENGLSGDTGRKIGAMTRIISGASMGGNLADAATRTALMRAVSGTNAAKFGQKLSIRARWIGRRIDVTVELARISQLEVGENERARIYVLLENTNRMIALSGSGTV